MAGADAARTSLDTRAVAGEPRDRPYVASMLRRLGYTESQIADYLAGRPLDRAEGVRAPAPTPRPTAGTAARDQAAPRDIEVEYTGPGLRNYRFVTPIGLEFSAVQQPEVEFQTAPEGFVFQEDATPWTDPAAEAPPEAPFDGWEGDGWRLYRHVDATGEDPIAEHGFAQVGEPVREDMVPAHVPEGYEVVSDEQGGEPHLAAIKQPFTGWEQDGWRLYRNRNAKGKDPIAEHGFAVVGAPVRDDMEPAQVPEGHQVVWNEAGEPALAATPFPGWEQDGWRLFRKTTPTGDDAVKNHTFSSKKGTPEGTEPAYVPEGYEVLWDKRGRPRLAKLQPAPPPGFETDEWKLYSTDEGEGEEAQRIFFFSKEQPDDAVPAVVPEGYEVATNPETGRPFLRRIDEDVDSSPIEPASDSSDPGAVAGRKRVRIVRVRAASREAAQRKMENEGRTVLATMPIDIEKKVN
ncbi:MAG: hypothetical protein AABX89_07105 [Candidatus Thermoplasmatota archaeon]